MKKACLLLTIGCVLSLLAKTGDARPLSDGYLFAHMVPENYGGLYYSVSRDGLHWELLNGGLPVNPEYRGHPDIVRGGDGRWHSIGIPRDPKAPLRGIHWISYDLMHWRQELLPESVFDCSALGRCPDSWLSAPKLFFDEATGDYVITWHAFDPAAEKAPVVKGERRAIWKSMRTVYVVTRDFKTFTKPKQLFAFTGADAEMAQIDTIIRKYKGVYYAVIKDERWEDECETGKLIRIARSQGTMISSRRIRLKALGIAWRALPVRARGTGASSESTRGRWREWSRRRFIYERNRGRCRFRTWRRGRCGRSLRL